jgi:hypothetical protein
MPLKRPKKTPTQNAASITEDQVNAWFQDADITRPKSVVSKHFAKVAESWRKRNLPDHQERKTNRAEINEKIETLLLEISRISGDLIAKIEILRKETSECTPIGRYRSIYNLNRELEQIRLLFRQRSVGQPKALWGEVAIEFYVHLKCSLPPRTTNEAICDVVTRALAQCGWVIKRKEVTRKVRGAMPRKAGTEGESPQGKQGAPRDMG